MSELHEHLSSEQLLYSTVWEDEALLAEALAITPEDDVLSISSAGCNALALLAAGARSVTAVDLNAVQLAELELKLAALKTLTVEELAELIGESPSTRRGDLYAKLRPALSSQAQAIWDARGALLEEGLVKTGRLERYFRMFAEQRLPKLWSLDFAYEVVDEKDPKKRLELVNERGKLPELEKLVRSHFSAEAMARDGRSEVQLKHADSPDVGAEMFRRFMDFIGQVPWSENHYLERLLTGKLRNPHVGGPAYLRPEVFELLKSRVDRVKLVRKDIGKLLTESPVGTYSKANFSDLFEYLSVDEANGLFEILETRLRDKGRMAYWNLLVPRVAPAKHGRIVTLENGPSPRDRIFFYGAFVVQELASSRHR